MNEHDLEELKKISGSLRRLNLKIKLISLLNRAKEEYEHNKLSDCQATCEQILTEDIHNPIALRGLGCVMQARGDYGSALKYYQRALRFSANKEIEYTLIGTIYYNQNNYEEAIKYYNMAIDINDNYDLAYEGKNQSILERHVEILDMQDSLIKRKIFK